MTGQVYYLNTKVGLTAAEIQQGTDKLCMQSIKNGEVLYVLYFSGVHAFLGKMAKNTEKQCLQGSMY